MVVVGLVSVAVAVAVVAAAVAVAVGRSVDGIAGAVMVVVSRLQCERRKGEGMPHVWWVGPQQPLFDTGNG